MISEAELPLEVPRRDALVDVVQLAVIASAAHHGQAVLLSRDRDLLRRKPGQRKRDAIAFLAGTHDVVGRVGVLRVGKFAIVDEIEETVKTDGRSPQGGEV